MRNLISRTISNIRLPMIIGIVMIHAKIDSGNNITFAAIQSTFSCIIASPCVPVFFLISAFLFFWNIRDFTIDAYSTKMKKRARSLLIPYLTWNGIAIAVFAYIHSYVPEFINPEFENVPEWQLDRYLAAFWNGSGGQPISYQLWFLRDLMIMIIITPLFYIVVYKMGLFRWIALAILIGINFSGGPGTFVGIMYFYLGTLMAWIVNKMSYSSNDSIEINKSFVYHTFKNRINIVLLFAALLFLSCIILYYNLENLPSWHNPLLRLSGTFTYLCLFLLLTRKGFKIPDYLSESSFFIYLYHGLPVLFTSKILVSLLHPASISLYFLTFILNIALIVIVGICLHTLLKKMPHKITILLSGGR